MPESLEDLVELLDLEKIDVDVFRGRQPQTSMQRVFGGQVLGQALAAASRTVDPERIVHSLHGYFLRGGDTAVPTKSLAVPRPEWLSPMSRSRCTAQTAQEIFRRVCFVNPAAGCARVAPKPKHTAATFFDRGGFLPDNGKPASQCR